MPAQSPSSPPAWQLVFAAAQFLVAVRCDEDMLFSAAYLPHGAAQLPPQNMLAAECAKQIKSYLNNPRHHRFDLPLVPAATAHQKRVREVISDIPAGVTMRYGDIAAKLKNSSARAVGGACRANALPLFVPCHRVVAANGVGGFMGEDGRASLSVKRWLLRHEGGL